jgi:hypothetical protein
MVFSEKGGIFAANVQPQPNPQHHPQNPWQHLLMTKLAKILPLHFVFYAKTPTFAPIKKHRKKIISIYGRSNLYARPKRHDERGCCGCVA